jgi:hypothetical protein
MDDCAAEQHEGDTTMTQLEELMSDWKDSDLYIDEHRGYQAKIEKEIASYPIRGQADADMLAA